MSAFEYVFVLVSLVIGLAITEILAGFARLLGEGGRIRAYWVQVLQLTFILLFAVGIWWTGWQLHDRVAWSLPTLLLFMVGPTVVYLAAHLAFPEGLAGEDLERFYYTVAPRVYLLLFVGLIWGLLARVMLLGGRMMEPQTVSISAAAILLVWLASTKKHTAHAAGVIALLVILAASMSLDNVVIAG